MIKNITLVVLTAWLSFFLLGGGHGDMTLTQMGIPVFITVLGGLIVAACHSSDDNE